MDRNITKKGIKISMSDCGRSNDNAYIERLWRTLKYEWMIIKGARNVSDYKELLPKFIQWYNNERPHQSLFYKTPSQMIEQQSNGDIIEHAHHHLIIGKQHAKDSLILTQ